MRAVLLAALALALAAPASATLFASVASVDIQDEGERLLWQARLRGARREVAESRARYQAALDSYRDIRHRRGVRGKRKAKAVIELDAAKAAVADAERRLEEFFEAARRAGIPPGWLRIPEEDGPAAPER